MAFTWSPGQPGAVRAGGKTLEAACYGPPPSEAPTIVMLHEGLGCVALWRDFPQRLAEGIGYGVFVYSRAGYGQSDPADLPRPLDYMTREAVDVLPEILDASGVEHAILLGHSDGATISAIYAGSIADHRVRGLVLMAPHFFTEPGGLAAIRQAHTAFETGDLRSRLAKYHAEPDVAFRGWNGAWLDPGFESWNVADVLDQMPVPVLAIQGEVDQYGTMAQVEVIAERSPAPISIQMLPGCGHSPYLEEPEKTLAAITRFVGGLGRAGTP